MTADIELLPLPEAEYRLSPYGEPCLHDSEQLADYARACVSHATAAKDAEIERLRAEREVIGAEAVKYAGKSGRLEAKVYLLAEAGRRVTAAFRAHGESSPFTRQAERTRHECEAAMLSLADALRDHDQENQRE